MHIVVANASKKLVDSHNVCRLEFLSDMSAALVPQYVGFSNNNYEDRADIKQSQTLIAHKI